MLVETQTVHVKATGKHHRRYGVQMSEAEFAAFVEASAPERPAKWQPSELTRALYAELKGALDRSRQLVRKAV